MCGNERLHVLQYSRIIGRLLTWDICCNDFSSEKMLCGPFDSTCATTYSLEFEVGSGLFSIFGALFPVLPNKFFTLGYKDHHVTSQRQEDGGLSHQQHGEGHQVLDETYRYVFAGQSTSHCNVSGLQLNISNEALVESRELIWDFHLLNEFRFRLDF